MLELPLPVLGSYFAYRDSSVLITATGPNQILGQNPNRWSLIFWNGGAGTQFIDPQGDMGGAGGMPLPSGGPALQLTFRNHGALVQGCWFATINPVGQPIGIIEVLYQPPAIPYQVGETQP